MRLGAASFFVVFGAALVVALFVAAGFFADLATMLVSAVMEVSSCSNCWRRLSGSELLGVRVRFRLKVESILSRTKTLREGSKYRMYWFSPTVRVPA